MQRKLKLICSLRHIEAFQWIGDLWRGRNLAEAFSASLPPNANSSAHGIRPKQGKPDQDPSPADFAAHKILRRRIALEQ